METKGLTTSEARKLQQQYGLNKIGEVHSLHIFAQLMGEIFSLLNMLLLGAAAISFFIKDLTDALLIVSIVVLNGIISFWQEFKAEKTLSELKKLSPSFARTVRDGREVMLNAEQLVPGDVIVIEAGDKIPADGVVIESANLEVNESILTGESVPVYKKPREADHDQVYSGTLTSAGRGRVQILKIGNETKFGKIAKTLGELKDTDTPLQIQIKKLAANLGILAVVLAGAIYVIGIALGYNNLQMFLTAVSSAVALVPEGLPSIMLITMAVGVMRMAQKRAIVRKLVAIEGLGSVNVICTDKTGTLTQGRMTVNSVWINGKTYPAEEFKPISAKKSGRMIVDGMVLVNTSSLVYKLDKRAPEVLGDTTEGALLLLAEQIGVNYELHRQQGQILDEFSFDTVSKSMSVVWKNNGVITALAKSSPEFMVRNSSKILVEGEILPLEETGKKKLVEAYEQMAGKGYRVLGFGFKENVAEKSKYDRAEIESDLVFAGFAALSDPLRPEVKQAIRQATAAGIRTVMITGDNQLTAMTIAKELGLASDSDTAMVGADLERLSDNELKSALEHVKIFARTNPEDKLRIVKAFQETGFSVAVTGDGVNDSLALKQAEIGVAMGKKGTDVAKEAADIVITDDNYATIITAIEEGRTIYDNVLKAIRYLLSTNIGEILSILIALIIGLPAPLLPAQILWTNLVSDGLPALALAVDPKDPTAMRRSPRAKQSKIIDAKVFGLLSLVGVVVSAVTLGVYWYVLNSTADLTLARTYAFTTLIVLQLIVAFIIHGRGKFNYNLLSAVVLTLLIQFIILATPQLHPIFEIKKPW
jgi:Ca2+-transporting ATPase